MAVYTTIFTENDFEEEKLALFVFGAVSLLTLVLALGRALLCPKAPDVKAMLDQYGFVEGGTSRGLSDSSPVLRQTPHTVLVLDDWSPATDSEMSASTSLAPCATLASAAAMDVMEPDEGASELGRKYVFSYSDENTKTGFFPI